MARFDYTMLRWANPTNQHFVTEMWTCVHISVTNWCIVGYLSSSSWDLWGGSNDLILCLYSPGEQMWGEKCYHQKPLLPTWPHDVVRIKETWWRHLMETNSALLAICAGNSPVPGEFPTQRPVTRSFDVYFDLRPNKWLSKQWWGWWFETSSCPLWRHRNGVGLVCYIYTYILKYIWVLSLTSNSLLNKHIVFCTTMK